MRAFICSSQHYVVWSKMKRAYRFRLYPKAKQVEQFEQTLTLCRRLYNAVLEHRIIAYRNGQPVTYLQQQNELPQIKRELSEYGLVYSQALQDALRRLDCAYRNFFRRVAEKRRSKKVKVGFPRFKSENRYNSLTYPQSGFRLLPNGHLLVDPKYTSQECSVCHSRVKIVLADRIFKCSSCGLIICRDVNAARVILERAFSVGGGTAEFTPVENTPLLTQTRRQACSWKQEAPTFRRERMSQRAVILK